MTLMLCFLAALAPEFTAAGVIPFGAVTPRLLKPGIVATIYGKRLGPPGCSEARVQPPHPAKACGVEVFVGKSPAGLLYVSPDQINLRIPDDAPPRGTSSVRVCAGGACSAPVNVRFSIDRAYIKVQGTARAGMPIWIEVEQPMRNEIRYPFEPWPWFFGFYELELRYEGQPVLRRAFKPTGGVIGGGPGGGTVAPPDSPQSRLPLHAVFDINRPGRYSVRFRTGQVPWLTPCESAWLPFTVAPADEAARDAWLTKLERRMQDASPGILVGDILPSLLAKVDNKSLRLIQSCRTHPNALVHEFARQSLAYFDVPPWD